MFYTVHAFSRMPLETQFDEVKKYLSHPCLASAHHTLCWGRDLGALATYLTPIVNMLRRGFPCTQPTSIRRPARDRTASVWAPMSPVLHRAYSGFLRGPLGTQMLGLSSDLGSLKLQSWERRMASCAWSPGAVSRTGGWASSAKGIRQDMYAWWLILTIPAFWRLRQEDSHGLEVSIDLVSNEQKQRNKKNPYPSIFSVKKKKQTTFY